MFYKHIVSFWYIQTTGCFFCIINSFNTVVSLFKDRILLLNLPLRASYLNEKNHEDKFMGSSHGRLFQNGRHQFMIFIKRFHLIWWEWGSTDFQINDAFPMISSSGSNSCCVIRFSFCLAAKPFLPEWILFFNAGFALFVY